MRRVSSIRLAASMMIVCLQAAGCLLESDWECRRSSECSDGEFCRAGTCVPAVSGRPTPDAAYGDTEADATRARGCEEGDPPVEGDLVLNEVLVNVPMGSDGDANGDGIRDAFEDEFVEIVNRTEETLDITDVKIGNGSSVKFSFDSACLEPQQAAVVFGGGRPRAGDDDSLVRVADARFAFSNDGGTVAVFDADREPLSTLTYDQSAPEALTLDPQLDGRNFVPHSELAEERPHSPGRCADGAVFADGCSSEE